MIKKISFLAVTVTTIVSIIFSGSYLMPSAADTKIIDNSDLMPKYVPDSEVKVNETGTPEWINTLIMAEVRIETCTEEGTFASAVKMLDHYQEMGVNGLWITPVNDTDLPGKEGNRYGNYGPHTIDPTLTGKSNYEEGWKVFKTFVDEAHKRNIRIVLDMISWGTLKSAPLYKEHPEWYTGKEEWGGWAFDWENKTFKEWYISQLVNIAVNTGIDGYRYDVEPHYAGYAVHAEIRSRLLAKGRKLLMMTEHENERGSSYDLAQYDMLYTKETLETPEPPFLFLDKYNIVDSVKTGENIGSKYSQETGDGAGYQYYTHTLNCHDNFGSIVRRNRLAIGYQAIYAPFIPMWYIGEEWNNFTNETRQVQYFNKIDWDKMNQPENRAFYEDVKAMIRVRRENSEIFEYFPEITRDANICKVNVAGCEAVQPYARYRGDTAIIIVPNYNVHDKSGNMTVYMPFASAGIENYKSYTVTNAVTGRELVSGSAVKVAKIDITVPYEDMLVLKVKASGKLIEPAASDSISDGNDGDAASNEMPADNSDLNEDTDKNDKSNKKKPKTGKAEVESENNNFIIILLSSLGGILITGAAVAFIIVKSKKAKSK